MREILFRGKRKDNGEWIYGDLRHCKFSDEEPYTAHIVDNSNGMNNSVCGLEVIPETIGQFTGLTDMNGRKIFEGDIIKYSANEVGIINYETCCFCVQDIKSRNNPAFDIVSTKFFNIEIVGNIHDNPELLEVSK